MDPETYFASLEPNLHRREKLIEQLKHAVTPRIGKKAAVIVTGPKNSGKSTLIATLMGIFPSRSVNVDASDVCRTWRSFEMAKISLQFVSLPYQSNLPMIAEGFHPFNLDSYGIPRFRYLMEDHKLNEYSDTYVIHVTLTQTFPDIPIKLDYRKIRSYLCEIQQDTPLTPLVGFYEEN